MLQTGILYLILMNMIMHDKPFVLWVLIGVITTLALIVKYSDLITLLD